MFVDYSKRQLVAGELAILYPFQFVARIIESDLPTASRSGQYRLRLPSNVL